MPYAWQETTQKAPGDPGAFCFAAGDPPLTRLRLWPHRSLPRVGFVWFVGLTAGLIALPLIGVLGTPHLWGLLPFLGLALAGIWWALMRSYRDGELVEELTLWRDRIELVRKAPRGPPQSWAADPHWVRVERHATGGPVADYLTLTGGGREVEIGAFLSPYERQALEPEIRAALRRVR